MKASKMPRGALKMVFGLIAVSQLVACATAPASVHTGNTFKVNADGSMTQTVDVKKINRDTGEVLGQTSQSGLVGFNKDVAGHTIDVTRTEANTGIDIVKLFTAIEIAKTGFENVSDADRLAYTDLIERAAHSSNTGVSKMAQDYLGQAADQNDRDNQTLSNVTINIKAAKKAPGM